MDVLVVDDEAGLRVLFTDIISFEGYEVVTAESAESAMKLLDERDFPVIVTDLRLGSMSGQGLLEWVKGSACSKSADVIIVTGHAELTSAISALRHGAFDFLEKPIMAEELIACVDRAAEHQRLLRSNETFRKQLTGLRGENRKVSQQLASYRQEFAKATGLTELTIASDHMRQVMEMAMVLHRDRSVPVLIQGETGTGKELVARLVHYGDGSEPPRPFVDLNCAAVAPSLFESELFGYEAGAFTGADSKGRVGKLEMGNGGSVFLDEIGECPLPEQAKLLRTLEEREIRRVGGTQKTKLDVRFIFATNRNVEEQVRAGEFRADLYYRLNVGIIRLAPLRDRPESIEMLAARFLREFSSNRGKRFASIADDALSAMLAYHWPGNIRELKNIIDRAVLLHDDVALRAHHLGLTQEPGLTAPAGSPMLSGDDLHLPPEGLDLEHLERQIIAKALAMCGNNKSRAARMLHLTRSKFLSRLGQLER